MEKNSYSILIILFLLFQILCSENNDVECPSKSDLCSFTVSKINNISPRIPTSFPTKAILGDYKYIYLLFSIPETQNQISFYLEAYDTSNKETIISNGDCYLINTIENLDYEIRIYKELKENSYVQFGFLGLPEDLTMTVELKFILDIDLYLSDIPLDFDNSLNKADIPSLNEYSEEREKQILEQKNREKKAKETCSKIMEKVFNTQLDINIFEDPDPYFSSTIIPVPPYFLLTLSYYVGLELTTESSFQLEKIILSETNINEGNIVTHYDGLDFVEGHPYISKDVYKLVELFNKRVTDMALEFGTENNFTLIISTNEDNSFIIYTFRFFYEKTEKINYEIQIKIQFTNSKLKDLVTLPEKSYAYLPFRGIDNPDTSNMSLNEKKIRYLLDGIYYVFGILNIIKKDIKSSMTLVPILINDLDYAEIGGTFLDMKKDENGIYHADFDCWQQFFGYHKLYDIVFDIFTDMKFNNEGIFTYNNQNYILWAWKGDYINLGAGAELGIYYGGKDKDSFWLVDKSLAMPMTLTLAHKIYGNIVDNWDNEGNNSWWITSFNPKYPRVKADDLTAYFSVKFENKDMFDEFSKIEREGWSYDKTTKIAYLIL